MSSRKTGTLKEKSSIGSGILALVRKKSKSKLPSENKRESSGPAKPVEVSGAESIVETIEFKPDFFEVEEESQVLKELGEQLTETQKRLSDAHLKSQENQQTIDQLQIRLSDLGQNNSCAQNKLKEMAEEKDAEITILKQQVEDLHQQLQNRQDLSNKVQRLTDEVTELQTQNQELRFQHERSSTRTRINSISEEKYTKEEVLKLQKELRMVERNMKIETANFEAQLKAAQDGNERLLEKVRISQLRFDELDKEKLDLKIEINRLQKKLEKSGSYSELKRLQTEQESVELELRNLKRKNIKLEKQLTNSNHIVNGHDNHPNGDLYPSRSKLSTSKATYLEKEISELESTVTKLKSENKKLEERADSAQQTSEVLTLKVKQLDEQLQAEKIKVQATEASFGELKKAAAGSAGEEYLECLLKQIESLNQASKDVETNFKVKEKDLWSTIEAQKKQIEELEMEKLALELGDVEGSDNEKESTPNPQISEKMVELESELDRLRKSNAELERNLNEVKEELMQSSQTESSTEKYKIEIDKKQNELTELRQDNEHLKKAIEEEIARIRELEELSTALQATNRDQLKKLEEFEGKDKAYSALENEKKSLAKQLQDLQAINKSLKKKLEEVEAAANQVPTLKSEIQKLTKQVADIKKSKSKEDGKKVSFDEISVLEKEVEKLTKANTQLTTDLEAAEDEIDHREDSSVKIKDERDKLLKENQKLKADLGLAEDELEKLDVELVQQTGKLLEQISQLKKENSEIRASATGKREGTPKPKETTPPRKGKEQQTDGSSFKKTQNVSPKKNQADTKEVTSAPSKLSTTEKFKTPPPSPSADKSSGVSVTVRSKTSKKSPTPPPTNTKPIKSDTPPAVTTKTKKVIAVGGVKLPTPPPAKLGTKEKEATPPIEDTQLPSTEEVGNIQTAPSLTPNFKKPPPAPKKKPSRNSLRKNSEEIQKQN